MSAPKLARAALPYMSTPEPIATGTLAKTPLAHLLAYLDQKKLTGTLAIWPDPVEGGEARGQDRILLLKGVPVAGQLLEPHPVLRQGLLKLFSRERAPYAFYETNLLGDDRVSGRVDPLSLITEAVRGGGRDGLVGQVLDRFGSFLLRLQPGIDLARYELQPEERALVDVLRAEPADVASLIAIGTLPEDRTRRLLYVLAITKAVAPHGAPAADRITVTGDEARAKPAAPPPPPPAAVAPLPPPPPPAAVAQPAAPTRSSIAPPPGASSKPPGESAPPPPMSLPPGGNPYGQLDRLNNIPSPPDGLSEELRQRWLRIMTKGRLIENQNYFEMLELDKDTKSTDARNKFYQLAKEWHPDRLAVELKSLREYVQIIFSYMSEANATLGDEVERVKYVQTVREGGGTPATDRLMQTILDTAMEYERVLVMARRHEYDQALELMIRILSVVRDDPEYHAMYASLLMQKFPGQDAPLHKMLESVDKALAAHERHERANLLKAQILRKMGRQDEALTWFRKVAEINPRNVDAVREVRVATMRAKQSGISLGGKGGKGKGKGKKEEPSGLFGKLFKKD
ncbi:MAG TPA: DnaJ domain-containing protein [Polyangiales bacterium]|nr:DnaJ domain-containing protein [Polyangiales bacterium]